MSNINTGGGTNVQGNAQAGRDFIGRDQIINQAAHYLPGALHQLRPIPATFTGRAADIDRLLAQLKRAQAGDQPVTNISSVKGMGGIGKTELANLAAHALAPDYPDAQLFVELGAHSPAPRSSAQALAYCIRAFGGDYAEAKLPDDVPSLRALYLSLLSGKRALVLLDDCASDTQARALLPPPGCACLITTRNPLSVGRPLPLDTLARAESVALLRALCERLTDAEAAQLAGLCADLPIALTVAGGFLSTRPTPVWKYIDKLKGADRVRVERLRKDEVAVEDIFAASYNALAADWQAALRALWVMAADFDRDAALAVISRGAEAQGNAGAGEGDACADCLDDLVAYHLIQYNPASERYDWHDLLRAYVRTQTPDEEYHRAARRHADHYKTILSVADDLYLQGGDDVLVGLGLFDQEWQHIKAGLDWAAEHAASDDDAARLCMDYANAGAYMIALRLHPHDRIRWLDAQLAAARTLGERQAEGNALGNLGNAYADLGEARQAITYYEQHLAIAREIGDRRGEGNALGDLGNAYADLGEAKQTIGYYEQALVIAREIGDRHGEGNSLGNLGNAYAALGDARQAIGYLEQALVIDREIGDRHGEGNGLWGLGIAYSVLGEVQTAARYYEQHLAIAREIGDRRGEGAALGNLGNAYYSLGEAQRAIPYHEQALVIAREIGDRRGEGNALGNLGNAYAVLGDVPKAIEYYEKALVILLDIGDLYKEAIHSWNLGLAYESLGDPARAIALMQVLVDFEREIGHADVEKDAADVDALRERMRSTDSGSGLNG